MENIADKDEDLWSAAAVAVTVITVCATALSVKKKKRKVWVKRLFQRRQSKGSYEMLLRELKDEDPDFIEFYRNTIVNQDK